MTLRLFCDVGSADCTRILDRGLWIGRLLDVTRRITRIKVCKRERERGLDSQACKGMGAGVRAGVCMRVFGHTWGTQALPTALV